MWYPTDLPVLESVFADVAPDAIDLHEVWGNYPSHPYTYQELLETTREGMVF